MAKEYGLLGFKNRDIDRISLIKEQEVSKGKKTQKKSCSCSHNKR